MHRQIRFACLIVSAMIAFCACKEKSGHSIRQKGNRELGLHVTTAQQQTYPEAFAVAREAGMSCLPQVLQWKNLEAADQYDPQNQLYITNAFFSSQQMPLSLCISPIFTTGRGLPADLMSLPFDHPLVIQRFKTLLDTVKQKLRDIDLRFLIIGNEVDLYLSQHPDEWTGYTNFANAVRTHARTLWHGVPVGSETTLGSMLNTDRDDIVQLNAEMDIVCFSYYHINEAFLMEPVSKLRDRIEPVFDLYPSRKLFIEECGIATGAGCGGSPQEQQSFVKEMFRIWDDHADGLVYVGFLWLTDLSLSQAQQVGVDYGLTTSNAFTEYIRTLGLIDETGTPKPALQTLKDEAAARGW